MYQKAVIEYRQGNSYNNLNSDSIKEVLAHRFAVYKVDVYDRNQRNIEANKRVHGDYRRYISRER